ncbi:MAG: TolC family protein [Culturomica sp.]|nr:TolC family protein [Culturomica sp.]
MKKRWIGLWALLLLPSLILAQETGVLSLQQAVAYAEEHNKQLQVSRKGVDIYKQKVREAIAQGLPQIGGTVNYNTNFGYEMNFGGNMPIKMKDQSNVVGSVSQLLFSGQWIVNVQVSKIAERLSVQQADITVLDIRENVCNTYYTVLSGERLKEIVSMNLENLNKVYEHTRNMYDAGTVEITDVDQIRITVGLLKNSLATLERNVELSYNLLRLQLGLKADQPLRLSDPLESFLDKEDYAKLAVQQFEISNNPEFQVMQTQEAMNKKMVGLQKWSYAPTISGQYSYTYKLLKPALDMSPQHAAGVVMSIPLFTGFERKSLVEQAKIGYEQTLLNKSLLEDQLYLNDKQYKFELKSATENYFLQKENIDLAKRVLENIRRKYEFGAVSSLDLTQANNNYLEAENNYTNACLTLLQAELKLERLYNEFSY